MVQLFVRILSEATKKPGLDSWEAWVSLWGIWASLWGGCRGGGQMNGQMDGWMYWFTLYSTGHRPLQGRCPKSKRKNTLKQATEQMNWLAQKRTESRKESRKSQRLLKASKKRESLFACSFSVAASLASFAALNCWLDCSFIHEIKQKRHVTVNWVCWFHVIYSEYGRVSDKVDGVRKKLRGPIKKTNRANKENRKNTEKVSPIEVFSAI